MHIAEMYETLGFPLRILDLAELPPEIFDPSCYTKKPSSFQPFSEAILEAKGLIIVTPEYNGSMSGVLKYFIDMLKFPESFANRPVCFVGLSASRWGALQPVEQLQQIFGYRNAYIFPDRVFLPNINSLLDASGHVVDPELLGRLNKQARGFMKFVEKLG